MAPMETWGGGGSGRCESHFFWASCDGAMLSSGLGLSENLIANELIFNTVKNVGLDECNVMSDFQKLRDWSET